MRRLIVAIVVPGFPVDRDEPGLAAVVDLVERLAAVHEVEIVALRHPSKRRSYRLAGATVRALGPAAGAGRGGPTGRAAVLARGLDAVARLHRRRPFDLVHGLWADEPGAVAALAGRLLRRPSIVSVMGGELVALADIDYGAALGRGGRWSVSTSMRLATLVSTGSMAMRDAATARRNGRAVVLLPLGVDIGAFRPAAGGAAEPAAGAAEPAAGAPTVLVAGGLEPVKDPIGALLAFAAVAGDRPGARLRFVGDGALRPTLEATARDLGLAERVSFAGQLPRNEMAQAYRGATVLLIASRHEGQSMVAVEAAASGLPVVGTRVGVLTELGDGARTVPVGDPAALAAALASALDDPEGLRRMGAAGRAVAEARFDIDRTSSDVLATWDGLLSRG